MSGMNPFYPITFAVVACCTVILERCKAPSNKTVTGNRGFLSFQNNYVFVYCLMMAGDWLQGPYVYALYQHYGYQVGDIGRLFIAGFGSSMVFGTIVGTMADQHGRKKAALAYVATYTLSCLTKHWGLFGVLMLGRLLGGVATSLLFSVFESWLVTEHFSRGYDEESLGETFSRAVLLGNGLVAILSGLLANTLVVTGNLGPVAPFDAAAVLLVTGAGVIAATWSENYGEHGHGKGVVAQLQSALACIARDERVRLLGVMQALFEGAMYTFVFLWTPALSPTGERIPHGFIFAMFMASSMAGSALAGLLCSRHVRPEQYMPTVYLVAALSMLAPIAFHMTSVPDATARSDVDISASGMLQCVSFCVFEVCIGMFWPSMMRMRATCLPDELRATLINCFRIPLNLFVCLVLYNVSKFPLAVMFGLCTVFMLVACGCCHRFAALQAKDGLRTGNDHDSVSLN